MPGSGGGYGGRQEAAGAVADGGPPVAERPAGTKDKAKRPLDADAALLKYVEDAYMDGALSAEVLKGLLDAARAQGGPCWNTRSEGGLTLLHMAAMNEWTPPEDLEACITMILEAGALLDAKDEDGDTALAAVMSLAQEDEAGDEEDEEFAETTREQHMTAVRTLLRCPKLVVEEQLVTDVCGWLRRYMPEPAQKQMLQELQNRAGEALVSRTWCSEQLLAYLERMAYDEKTGISANVVEDFLRRGASPCHSQKGATALLFAVLNPYTKYKELTRVVRLMLEKEPTVVEIRDGFKLRPLQWAADYKNVARQHDLRKPNPAALLALMPCITTLPAQVDAGEVCLKVSPAEGFCPRVPADGAPVLRFLEGDRVVCRVEAPGVCTAWEEGVVIALWYRERCWPAAHPGAPYEVRLDIGNRVYALVDHDRIIRRLTAPAAVARSDAATPLQNAPVAVQQGAAGARAPASTSRTVKPSGSRFQRRQRADGGWELLDTVSGKARPCLPPDSEEEA